MFLGTDDRGRQVICRGDYSGEWLDDVALEDPMYLRRVANMRNTTKAEKEIIKQALESADAHNKKLFGVSLPERARSAERSWIRDLTGRNIKAQ